MVLSFRKKQAIKADDKKRTIKTDDKKRTTKSDEHRRLIREYLEKNGESKTADIAEGIGLSLTRTKMAIYEMDDIEAVGGNRNRTYRLKRK